MVILTIHWNWNIKFENVQFKSCLVPFKDDKLKKPGFDIFADLLNYLNNPEQIFLDTITGIFLYLKPFLNQTIREYEITQIHFTVLH